MSRTAASRSRGGSAAREGSESARSIVARRRELRSYRTRSDAFGHGHALRAGTAAQIDDAFADTPRHVAPALGIGKVIGRRETCGAQVSAQNVISAGLHIRHRIVRVKYGRHIVARSRVRFRIAVAVTAFGVLPALGVFRVTGR